MCVLAFRFFFFLGINIHLIHPFTTGAKALHLEHVADAVMHSLHELWFAVGG